MYSANIASQNSIKSPTPNKSTLVENRGVGDCRSTILLAEMHPFYTVSVGVMVLQALPNIFVTLHTFFTPIPHLTRFQLMWFPLAR